MTHLFSGNFGSGHTFGFGGTNPFEYSKVVLAIKANNIDQFNLLIRDVPIDSLKTKIDDNGNTLLHHATNYKRKSIIDYLLKNGFDKHQMNSFGESAWTAAVKTHDQGLIQTFIDVDITQIKKCEDLVEKYKNETKNWKNMYNELKTSNNILFKEKTDLATKCATITHNLAVTKAEVGKWKTHHDTLLEMYNSKDKVTAIQFETYKKELKRVRSEKEDLEHVNKQLKTSVDNLTRMMRK